MPAIRWRGALIILMAGLGVSLLTAEQTPAEKRAAPTSAQAQYGAGMVKQAYTEEFAGARMAAKKLELAKQLIGALDAEKDAVMRFSLMSSARDLSVEAGNYLSAADAIDRLNNEFVVDALKMKCDALIGMTRMADVPRAKAEFIQNGGDLIEAATAVDRFDLADALLEKMKQVAHGADVDTQKMVTARGQQLADLHAAYTDIQKVQVTLAGDPTNAAANLKMGRYLCFLKGEWARGLANLAQGSDATIKALAQQETTGELKGAEAGKVADGWWAIGDKEKGAAQTHIQLHAAGLYQSALPELTGLAKATAQNRITSLGSLVPRPPKVLSPQVEQEIQATIKILNDTQDDNGGWEKGLRRDQIWYMTDTGQVCLAMLAAGESPAKNPQLASALQLLVTQDIKDIGSVATRMQVMDLLNTSSARAELKLDLEKLYKMQAIDGQFTENPVEGTAPPSTHTRYTFDGAMALAAAAHQGVKVEEFRWTAMADRLMAKQNKNGGWDFCNENATDVPKRTAEKETWENPTACAVAILCIDRDHISNAGERDRITLSINAGIDHIDTFKEQEERAPIDMLRYQVVGQSTGRTELGGQDWYKGCFDDLRKPMRDAKPSPQFLAQKILFLARGGAE